MGLLRTSSREPVGWRPLVLFSRRAGDRLIDVTKDSEQGQPQTGPSHGTPPLWDAERLRDPHRQPDKARRVRRMFDAIAPTYERVNRWTSFGCDARWRRRAVRLGGTTRQDSVLDVACGTGDLARAFAGVARAVVGVDFAENMLAHARADAAEGGVRAGPAWCRADALRLPFAEGTFNMASCAFGVRNFQDLDAGLSEMYRTLCPGGRAVIVEFSMPSNRVIRRLYALYFERVLPALAARISRDRTGAYDYLARSVVQFIDPHEMVARLRSVGFATVSTHPLTFGAVVVYVAEKSL